MYLASSMRQAMADLVKFMDSVHAHMNNIQKKKRDIKESVENGEPLPLPKTELLVMPF